MKRTIEIPDEIDKDLIKLKGYYGFKSINEIYIEAAKQMKQIWYPQIKEIEEKDTH